MRAGVIDYGIYTLLLMLMAFVDQKTFFAGRLYRADVCLILNAGRTVFREAVRALLPLQLETLSKKQLTETAEKAPPGKGAYLCWLSVTVQLEGLFFERPVWPKLAICFIIFTAALAKWK